MAIDHKEPRYIFAAHSLLSVAAAVGLTRQLRLVRFASLLTIVVMLGTLARFAFVTDYYYQIAADMRAAFRALRHDPDVRALAIFDVEFGSLPGYFTLHRNLPIQLAEMAAPGGGALAPGFTHIVVPNAYPEVPGFTPAATFGMVSIRKRRDIDPTAPLPETSRLLPMAYTPGTGMHYRQRSPSQVDSAGQPVPNRPQ